MKKTVWGKSLLGVAALAMGLALAGCSSNSADKKSGSDSKVTITFWHGMNGPYAKALNTIIKDFNDSEDKYVVKGTAQGDYTALQQKIMAGAKSKSLPTIAQTTYTTVPDYVKNGFITPLDPYMIDGSDKLSASDLKDIYPAFISSSKYQGKYYSIPFSKSTRIMYYNKTLMDKLGVKMPTSWEDIAKMAPSLKAKGVMAVGFDKSFDMELEGLARQNGNALVATKGKSFKANLDSKKTLEATHFIWDMIQNGEAKTAGEDIYGDKAFTSGKTLFYVGSSAGVSHMKTGAPKDLDWGTMPLPTYKGESATELAGNDIVMFKSASTDQQKGAWAFMKFLMSKKETIKWAEATGYVPLRKSAVEDAGFQAFLKKDPTAVASVDSLAAGFQSTAFIGFTEYRNNLLSAVDAMLTKKETPEKAMGDLQTKTEQIIKDNN
ncbi:ABC transporter substrate-binding protein [Lacticaseibacillus absianus]|uniref:ABC transporter substrate-binding protein n=1 Tax=Lacticaseibacillus absianus TaxID=2729623 RepID=UPI0015CD1626|nr:ABC transporter substrate-binding protein [Lacticaseibacillus absianus]